MHFTDFFVTLFIVLLNYCDECVSRCFSAFKLLFTYLYELGFINLCTMSKIFKLEITG